MEIDDAVEQRKDVGTEVRHVLHGVVVGVEDGEEVVHPGRVDEGPGHDREEGYLDGVSPYRFVKRQIVTYMKVFCT